MKAILNGVQVEAKPQDVVEIIRQLSGIKKSRKIQVNDGQQAAPYQQQMPINDLQQTVKQSQELRKKLEADPSYNPYPGVVASKDTITNNILPVNAERTFAADLETGVSDGF